MESSAQEWFDSDEAEFQMRTAVRNSTVLWPRARLVLETLMVLMSLGAVTGEQYSTQQHDSLMSVNESSCEILHLISNNI